MNLLLILVLALFVGNIIWGYKKGFLRVAYSLVAWVILLAAVSWVTPYVSEFVVNSTEIDTSIQQGITTKLQEVVADADVEIKLPEVISTNILGIEASMDGDVLIDQALQESGAYEEVSLKLTMLVINAACFIVVFIVTKIILTIIEKILGFIHKLPLIGDADALLGVIAGAIKALVITWVVMAVVALLSTTEYGGIIVAMIYESIPLAWLYENNLILNLMISFL
jgi:uncharacterized membrane protein required for colicin V production